MGNMLLNLDDFVRVTQETGETIVGRYDGVDYTFPDGAAVDVHKAVACHIFGFGLREESDDPRIQDKTPALLRLNWIRDTGPNPQTRAQALKLLRKVRFDEIPPFPNVLRMRQPEVETGLTEVQIPESVNAGGLVNADGEGAVASGGPQVPRQTLHLRGKG